MEDIEKVLKELQEKIDLSCPEGDYDPLIDFVKKQLIKFYNQGQKDALEMQMKIQRALNK